MRETPRQDASQDATVAALVREGDRDRYLAALFAPEAKRPALLALAAFNIELSRIAELVSEPMLGEIRLQWWRDALAGQSEETRTGNPVAEAMGEAMRAHDLPMAALVGLIDARTFDVSGETMPDLPALKAYLNKTAGALFALWAQVLEGAPLRPEETAREAGLAYGLTGLMRALPVHRARAQLFLPATAFADQQMQAGEVLAGVADARLERALAALREEARGSLARARGGIADLPKAARPAFLLLALVEPYLAALARPDHDPLRQVADIGPLRRLWYLTRAAAMGKV